MLTDTKLRNLKPVDKLYKVNDRKVSMWGRLRKRNLWSLPFCNTDLTTSWLA